MCFLASCDHFSFWTRRDHDDIACICSWRYSLGYSVKNSDVSAHLRDLCMAVFSSFLRFQLSSWDCCSRMHLLHDTILYETVHTKNIYICFLKPWFPRRCPDCSFLYRGGWTRANCLSAERMCDTVFRLGTLVERQGRWQIATCPGRGRSTSAFGDFCLADVVRWNVKDCP